MGTQPDELRHEVEDTRAHLAHNVNLLADRVTPRKVARRKADAAHHRLTGIKERVMGSANDAKSSLTDTAHGVADTSGRAAGNVSDTVKGATGQVADAAQQAPTRIKQQTQGNPIAAGIIAFGAGMLAATLLPVSKAEEQVGEQVREHSDELLQPAKQVAQGAAQDIKEGLRQPATDAMESVKSTAQEAAQTSKEHAQSAGQHTTRNLREVGQDAAHEVRDQTGRPTGA